MKLLITTIAAVLVVGTALADPIHDAAGNGDLAGVQAELDKGVEVDAKIWTRTPLHFAANNGHKEVAELLITKGADVNAKDDDGSTPLYYAAYKGYKEVAELLIGKGADVNPDNVSLGWTALFAAIFLPHKETVELLIANGANVNARDSRGSTPLHSAASGGHKEIAELLIANGADVNAGDMYGWTPLYFAAKEGHKEIAELLIAKGADVNAKEDGYGQTPLHLAASKEVANLLITEGADVNAMNDDGKTPLDNAEQIYDWQSQEVKAANKEIASLFRKHGGKTGAELALMPPRLVPHGRFAFSFDAKEGKVYEVQDSFDLLNWEVIKTYTGTGDLVRFDEERDHDPPKWFYRVKVVE